ncbi:MAG TPA: SDR family NAD(P)-dependent oxidoreductase, partial [Steroidobacteraceae bacterium]
MYRIEELSARRVLVTGASSGIGAAVIEAFAQQGASVALHFHANGGAAQQVAQRIRDAGGSVVTVQGDLAGAGSAKRIVEESAQALGGLDILVNNAGSLVERRPILASDDALVDAIFDLN